MAERLSDEQKKLRKKLGPILKSYRTLAGLTQLELANKLGFKAYTFVSQLEGGTGKVPSEVIPKMAKAFGVSEKELAKLLLKHYDPDMYKALFGGK
ncbi:MAG: XRE family transcriptional regulator [Gammaproteobacteria bacterium]|nr:MAG: XRE family transcriptional regulator [Gammaproteobacteria bacterium]